MNIRAPKLPKELMDIEDFSACCQESLLEEKPISNIKFLKAEAEGEDFAKVEIQNSVFENCTFQDCDFEKGSFVDVVFRSCDLSNSRFSSAYFERCQFISCKCVGIYMDETIIKHTAMKDAKFQFCSFNQTKIKEVLFEEVDFSESSLAEATLKGFRASNSKFIKNNFFKTMLAGIDFSDNEFVSPTVSTPPVELKGAVINMVQAADLVSLWGLVVKQ